MHCYKTWTVFIVIKPGTLFIVIKPGPYSLLYNLDLIHGPYSSL